MDEFLRGWVCASPGELLETERDPLADIVARRFGCEPALARRAIGWLAGADRLLRRARLPRLSRALLARLDRSLAPRFEAYVRETSALLSQAGAALEGVHPAGDPDPVEPALAGPLAGRTLPQTLL